MTERPETEKPTSDTPTTVNRERATGPFSKPFPAVQTGNEVIWDPSDPEAVPTSKPADPRMWRPKKQR